MTYRRLNDLADVLRDAGLKVVEVPGWKENGRPSSTGGFNPGGNLWHHTGAKDTNPNSITDDYAYARWLAEIGRSDLPAPLCQVSIGRDGTVYVCASGRGNHAGTARSTGPMAAGDGNYIYLGWECQNSGSEGWSKAQYDAMVLAGAATSIHYGWSAQANRAHRETSLTGKWDPGGLDMNRFRNDIESKIKSLKEDDVPNYRDWSEADKKALAQDVAAETVEALMSFEIIPRKDINVRDALRYGGAKKAAKADQAEDEAAEKK